MRFIRLSCVMSNCESGNAISLLVYLGRILFMYASASVCVFVCVYVHKLVSPLNLIRDDACRRGCCALNVGHISRIVFAALSLARFVCLDERLSCLPAPAPAAPVTTVAAATTAIGSERHRVKTVTNADSLHLSHTDRTPSVTSCPHVEHGAALPDLLLREHLLGQGRREG